MTSGRDVSEQSEQNRVVEMDSAKIRYVNKHRRKLESTKRYRSTRLCRSAAFEAVKGVISKWHTPEEQDGCRLSTQRQGATTLVKALMVNATTHAKEENGEHQLYVVTGWFICLLSSSLALADSTVSTCSGVPAASRLLWLEMQYETVPVIVTHRP